MNAELIIFGQKTPLDATYLSAWGAIITIPDLNKLVQFKQLKHLNLSSTNLQDEHLEIIGTLTQLEMLDLDCLDITNKGLFFLSNLLNLKQLRLKDNPQLTDICVPYLLQLPAIQQLHLVNTQLSILGLAQLLELPTLENIIISQSDATFVERELIRLTSQYRTCEILVKGWGIYKAGQLS